MLDSDTEVKSKSPAQLSITIEPNKGPIIPSTITKDDLIVEQGGKVPDPIPWHHQTNHTVLKGGGHGPSLPDASHLKEIPQQKYVFEKLLEDLSKPSDEARELADAMVVIYQALEGILNPEVWQVSLGEYSPRGRIAELCEVIFQHQVNKYGSFGDAAKKRAASIVHVQLKYSLPEWYRQETGIFPVVPAQKRAKRVK